MTRIHDLLDLPVAVRKGDFVQDLTGGIASPEGASRALVARLSGRPARYLAAGDQP